MRGQGTFFDGESAQKHIVSMELSADRLSLVIRGDTLPEPLYWRLTELRALSDDNASQGRLVLTRLLPTEDEAPRDPARLTIDDAELAEAIRRSRPNLEKRDLHPGTRKRIIRNLAMAVAAVVIMLFVILPAMANTLARIIPLEREIAFGKTVTAQMERYLGADRLGALHCSNADGLAALDQMAARLTDGQDLGYDIQLTVFDHGMVNAFAAPGGQVVILRGLIDEAKTADQVAGVLAHEIGHVVHRDATRNALRATGSAGLLSMVLGDFTGGALLVIVGEQLINSSYSREAERQADEFALETLGSSGVSSHGLAAFFDAIDDDGEGNFIPPYLASHPVTGGRAKIARAFAEKQSDTTPVITEAEWAALQNVCE